MNFDNRSLAFNNETLLLVLDAGFGGQLEKMFEGDMKHCREIQLETFRQRGYRERAMEKVYSAMFRVL